MNREGEEYTTNEGYLIKIIKYNSAINCDIQFIKNNCIITNIEYGAIKGGRVKNPFHPSVFGVGYIGKGKYKGYIKSKATNTYNRWKGMLERCYNSKFHIKHPTYKNCKVSPYWFNYQNFVDWFDKNYVEGWELDKDIIVTGNNIYGEKYCCFVPKEINIQFKGYRKSSEHPVGVYKSGNKIAAQLCRYGKIYWLGSFNTYEEAFKVYKNAKETYVKLLADKYKLQLTDKIYKCLINYKV